MDRRVCEDLRDVDDWGAAALAVAAIALVLTTIRTTSWIAHAWLSALGLFSIPGLIRRSPWARL